MEVNSIFGAILIIIWVAYILVQCVQLYFLGRYKATFKEQPNFWPQISIWVAARNEAHNIAACLDHLLALDYPKDKIQILIGNDQSTDNTREIVLDYCKNHPQIQLVDVVNQENNLKAKARVMAQLDIHAHGDYYLITDADVQVNPQWAKSMICSLHTLKTGVASGTTVVKSPKIWGWLQEIDWGYFMGLLNIISYAGVPATAVGNNMIVRKSAYWQTGGYGKIEFSITEDYKLYAEICEQGYGWNNVMHPNVVAKSAETKGFIPLLHQRKRWLTGGKDLPWYWWILFGVFGLFHLLSPWFFWAIFPFAWIFGLIKWLFQVVQIKLIYKNIAQPSPNLIKLLLYEFFMHAVTICTAIFFLLPVKTVWKGRAYR